MEIRDDVKVYLLVILAAVGIPLNCVYLVLSAIQYRYQKTRMLLVQIHRSIIDILFLSIYTSSQIYMIVRGWNAGTTMCKLVYFLRHFCFSLSSNLIICIAMDRLHAVQHLTHVQNQRPIRKMVYMLAFIWALSAIIALPVLFVRTGTQIHNQEVCVFIWVTNATLNEYVLNPPIQEHVFLFYDIISKFWMPFILVMAIYLDVALLLRKQLHSHRPSVTLRTIPNDEQSNIETEFISNTAPSHANDAPLTAKSRLSVFSRKTTTSSIHRVSVAAEWRGVKAIKRGIYFAMAIMVVHGLFCMPYSTLALIMAFDRKGYLKSPMSHILNMVVLLGSVVNPIVYKHSLNK